MAISYAAGPAILAALRPDTAPQVRFLVAIGGYYDTEAVVTFFTTGYYRSGPDQPWQQGEPNAYGKWVFVAANAERLDDPGDRERTRRHGRAQAERSRGRRRRSRRRGSGRRAAR